MPVQRFLPLFFTFLLAFPLAAAAEEVPAVAAVDTMDGTTASVDGDGVKREAITVTAVADTPPADTSVLKTPTALRDIPASIQIVPREVLTQQGAQSVNDSIRNVSGITQSSSSNYGFFNNYLVRGLQQTFLRNGVSDGATVNGYARTLTGVERIEVLKGPGSALFGSTAPGGTINVVLRSPSAENAVDATATFGAFGSESLTVGVTGPLFSPRVLYRIDGAHVRADGYRGLENRTTELMPRFTLVLSDSNVLSADLAFHRVELASDSYGIPFRGLKLADVDHDNRYYSPFSNTDQSIGRIALRDEWMLSPNLSIRANASHVQRELELGRNAGGAVSANSTLMNRRTFRTQSDSTQDTVALVESLYTVTLGSTRHLILSGVEAQQHDAEAMRATANVGDIRDIFHPVVPETSQDALVFTTNFDRDLSQTQRAFYLQDQVEITPRLKARVGGRFDHFETEDYDRVTGVTTSRVDSPISGQAGLVFQPVSALSLFAGVAKGRFAIFSTETAISARAPEGSTQYELGSKATLLGGRLAMTAAAFRVQRENFLVTINGEPQPVGEQRTDGIELDIMGRPTNRLQLAANYALQDAELVDVPVAANATPVNGKKATGVPRHSASLWSAYELTSAFRVGAGATYRHSIFFDQLNTQTIPSYLTVDGLLGYHWSHLDLQLNVRNITNREYFRNGVNVGAFPGEPRNVTLTARFNQ
jgi:iron complex outermembrane receptor protein